MNLNDIVKGLRQKHLKTQDYLATKLNVSRQTYNQYENNIKKCDVETVILILKAIEVTEYERKEFFNAFEQDILS